MFKLRPEDGQLLFAIALSLHIIISIISCTNDLKDFFTNTPTVSIVRYTVFALLIAKIALDGLKFSLWQIVLVALATMQCIISHGGSLLYIYIFAMASRNVDILRISKIVIPTVALASVIVVLLFIFGFTSEMALPAYDGRGERHSLGFNNPNILAGYLLALAYAFFISFDTKAKTTIGILIFTIIGYLITGTRTLLLTVIILFFCNFIFDIGNKYIKLIAIFLIPVVALVDIVFLYQFSYGPIESELDTISSYRFTYIYRLIHNVPITWLGDATVFGEDSDAFDNSYAWFLINYGVIGTTMFIVSILFGALKNRDNTQLIALCCAVCFSGLLESFMYNPVVAFPLLKIIVDGVNIRLHRS